MSDFVAKSIEKINLLLEDQKETAVIYTEQEELISVLRHLKSVGFTLLVDIFGVDYPQDKKRIELVYILLDMKCNRRFHLKLRVDPERDFVLTACRVFKSANWFEREAFDMYGVHFSDHPDMRRILTDYQFEGYPMLKDFPLTGYKEVRYDIESKSVVYDDVDLPQEYRTFDFLTPWEGTKYIDELSPGSKNQEKEG